MSLSTEDAQKRANKAKKTKAANLRLKAEQMDELQKEKQKTARARSELKAYKDLIKSGWAPPGGK